VLRLGRRLREGRSVNRRNCGEVCGEVGRNCGSVGRRGGGREGGRRRGGLGVGGEGEGEGGGEEKRRPIWRKKLARSRWRGNDRGGGKGRAATVEDDRHGARRRRGVGEDEEQASRSFINSAARKGKSRKIIPPSIACSCYVRRCARSPSSKASYRSQGRRDFFVATDIPYSLLQTA